MTVSSGRKSSTELHPTKSSPLDSCSSCWWYAFCWQIHQFHKNFQITSQVDGFILILITWYIEAVNPGGEGVPQKPWFFILVGMVGGKMSNEMILALILVPGWKQGSSFGGRSTSRIPEGIQQTASKGIIFQILIIVNVSYCSDGGNRH